MVLDHRISVGLNLNSFQTPNPFGSQFLNLYILEAILSKICNKINSFCASFINRYEQQRDYSQGSPQAHHRR